jgi:hypothetical protein
VGQVNKLLKEEFRKVYTARLLEALKEVDVVDKEGNVLISKDLKIVHKDSGYEYTVDDVVDTADGVKFLLRKPDQPRVDPEPATTLLDELDSIVSSRMSKAEEGELEDGDIFIVDQSSFEKEYEVK